MVGASRRPLVDAVGLRCRRNRSGMLAEHAHRGVAPLEPLAESSRWSIVVVRASRRDHSLPLQSERTAPAVGAVQCVAIGWARTCRCSSAIRHRRWQPSSRCSSLRQVDGTGSLTDCAPSLRCLRWSRSRSRRILSALHRWSRGAHIKAPSLFAAAVGVRHPCSRRHAAFAPSALRLRSASTALPPLAEGAHRRAAHRWSHSRSARLVARRCRWSTLPRLCRAWPLSRPQREAILRPSPRSCATPFIAVAVVCVLSGEFAEALPPALA